LAGLFYGPITAVEVVTELVFFGSPSLLKEKVCSLETPSLPIEVILFFFFVGSRLSGSLFGI
jgi:hypothetical protein